VCLPAAKRLTCAILYYEGRILQSLNVKNPKAYAFASQLAALTGESLTAVVIASLEKSLVEERVKRRGKSKAQRMREFAKKFKDGMAPGSHSSGHADLYGEDGLPI
jgi:hypothetical protein